MKIKTSVFILLSAMLTASAQTDQTKERVREVITGYMPTPYGFAIPKVDSIGIDNKKKEVTVKCSETITYIPLTVDALRQLKSGILETMHGLDGYNVKIIAADGRDLDKLAYLAPKKVVRPKEKGKFVTHVDGVKAPLGLENNHIALWQSHGRYFNQKTNQWSWQRPRLWTTCEDLFTQSFVMPFLMPMLENAGAYVMSPRERDIQVNEYIIDNDDSKAEYEETGVWGDTGNPGFGWDGENLQGMQNPFTGGTARMIAAAGKKSPVAVASWNEDIDNPGLYAVYVSYQSLPKSATDAEYTINAANGPHKVKVNQRIGGGTWIYLGHYPFNEGLSDTPLVTLSNSSADKGAVITADAVKIGGGMGNVARTPLAPADTLIDYEATVSGYPRFTECSRYWLQWAGAPDSVYSQTHGTDDYTDDYTSRARWVNWLAGGSSVLPDRKGLGIPVDLSFAFHSDAGITPDSTVIGTLGIYYTNNRESYENGTARLAARDLTDAVMTNIVDDVKRTFNPDWVRRGMWDRNYAEARVAEVPSMLLELLSHQNFADMQYGLDPAFRFVVSRAIYKGMLEFLSRRDGHPMVVQPLPVRRMQLSGGENGNYRLSWAERVDSLEPTATPTYYIIEERIGDGLGFKKLSQTADTHYDITVSDDSIHSYRVIAGNDGGISFPSEVLALRYIPGKPRVMVVNGFDRVGAPAAYDFGETVGFYEDIDPGVPYVYDIAMTGPQFEFRRNIPWATNESAGTGASRSYHEDRVIPGNTFDFVYVHGKSISAAGYGFISAGAEAFAADGTDAPVVDLILGAQKESVTGTGFYGSHYKTFSPQMQQRLTDYAKAGGNIMVSGAYIGTDLWCNPFSDKVTEETDTKFAEDILGYKWRCGNAATGAAIIGVSSPFRMFDKERFTVWPSPVSGSYDASYDAISPASASSHSILKYEHTDFMAGTAMESDTHKAVVLGVPFEIIWKADQRDTLMKNILKFLIK